MGWFNERAPRHEGYVIGIGSGTNERGSTVFRELGSDDDGQKLELRIVQVGCDCGWRSQRLRAPCGTTWDQWVEFPRTECDGNDAGLSGRKPFETLCRDLWRDHAIGATEADLEPVDE